MKNEWKSYLDRFVTDRHNDSCTNLQVLSSLLRQLFGYHIKNFCFFYLSMVFNNGSATSLQDRFVQRKSSASRACCTREIKTCCKEEEAGGHASETLKIGACFIGTPEIWLYIYRKKSCYPWLAFFRTEATIGNHDC